MYGEKSMRPSLAVVVNDAITCDTLSSIRPVIHKLNIEQLANLALVFHYHF